MSARVNVPKGATVARQHRAIVPSGPNAGAEYELTLYRGLASQGYQSGYERIPHAWLVLRVNGRAWGSWQYSGNRLPTAERDYAANLADLEAAQ